MIFIKISEIPTNPEAYFLETMLNSMKNVIHTFG